MKNNYLNKNLFLLTSSLFFGLNTLLPEITMSQHPKTANFKTFEDLCKGKDKVSNDIRHTVEELLLVTRTSDCTIAREKLSKARYLPFNNRGISNLLPLSFFPNLTKLNLTNNQIVDIKPLEKLTKLTELGISDNRISDLSPLRNMKDLTFLAVKRNQISDVSPLQNLTNLQRLFLDDNKITDIMPLQSLKKLSLARFTGNPIIKKVCPVEGTVYMPKCSF
jgi:internalin A